MSKRIDPARFDVGQPTALCTCGHMASGHLGDVGACFGPPGHDGMCPSLCRRFAHDGAANAKARDRVERANREYDRIDAAAPFIDAGWTGQGWRPSQLMTVGYSVVATGPHPAGAAMFLDDLIAEARSRYRSGFYADPFEESARLRPTQEGPVDVG